MEPHDHNNALNADHPNNLALVRDKYCYYCDRKCYKCHCSTCFRSFHVDCLKQKCGKTPINHRANLFICPVCIDLEKAKANFVGKESLLGLLKYLINAILNIPDCENLKNLQGESIANPIDLDVVKQNVDNMAYGSLDAFQVDIDCIFHNVRTLVNRSPTRELVKLSIAASKLGQLCELEIHHILSCAECYEMKYTKPNEWQTLACSKPHLVLWVRFDREITKFSSQLKWGNAHWPAKLLSLDDNTVKVIFFGHSELVEVPVKNCFIYSTTTILPLRRSETCLLRRPKDINNALKEVDSYKQSIEQKFCCFNDKLKSIPFKPRQYNRHMRDMFPEYANGSSHDSNESGFDEFDFDGHSDSSSDDSEEGTSDYTDGTSETSGSTDDSKDDEIPKKRPRLSQKNESESNTIVEDSHSSSSTPKNSLSPDNDPIPSNSAIIPSDISSTSSSNDIQSNLSPIGEPSQSEVTIHEELQAIKLLEDMVMKRENLNQTKGQHMRNELENAKKSNSDWQAKYAALESRMQHALAEQEKFKANHKREMNELGDQHKRELEFENKRAADEMEKMIMEHRQKVIELEDQIKNITEQKAKDEEQLKESFGKIVNNLTQKAEAKKCEGCGQFKTELFCGSLCEGAWTSFRNSSVSG